MKLDYRRTILIGFAFLSISSFWQMYDNLIPLILTKTFDINEAISGVIMAADNVLALFLLPLFGGISDRSNFKMGKRKPFILVGTISAVILMMGLPLLDNSYFVAPALWKLIGFIVLLGFLLVAMGTYRSPAVALMPDVTPKPLRSKGNAIINLMGAVGGILYLIANALLYSKSKTEGLKHINYQPMFLVVGGIMIISLLILMFLVNEPKLRKVQLDYESQHPEESVTVTNNKGKQKMPKAVKVSLIFLLLSVAFWYIGYNAITTWFSVYATTMWDMTPGEASLCLTVATAGAIVSYIPVGIIASKVGRKITILFGAGLLAVCFFTAFVYTLVFGHFHWALYILFVLVGVAWAAINVNSLPMVVEMCSGSDIGKFTGFYYTFSMAAQTVTPILAGFLLSNVSYKTLFPYAAIFVTLSFVTMLFVRHGDSKPVRKSSVLENFDMDD